MSYAGGLPEDTPFGLNPAKVNGMYEAMMGGARPRLGTPPFAGPFPQTGGTNMPTTPDTLPAKSGISGFIDRLLNPTNALGQFGQALVAGGGGPLGNAMGYMIQQRAAAGKGDREFTQWQRQYDYERNNPKPSTAQPYRWERNDGSVMELGADGTPRVLYEDPNKKTVTWQTVDNGDGTKSLIPVPLGGGVPAASAGLGNGDKPDWSKLGGGAGNGTGGFPVNRQAFGRAIIAQEAGGRYGIANAQGSGAMGVGQVMPDTGRVLAGRLGLPWSPALMAGKSPAARKYQDAITGAALDEAWNAGNGDPSVAAAYYFGGSDRNKWGPKTRRYQRDILARMRGN